MTRVETKSARLLQIEALLLAYPNGLTQSEIARKLGVNRSTIYRDLPDLPKHIYFDKSDHGKWKVDRQVYLVNVRFDLHEATAVHLATRLLTTRMDRINPSAASALRKLGIALEKLAPQISHHMLQSAEAMETPERIQDPIYLRVLRDLTQAWAEQKKVLVHYSNASGHTSQNIFAPYFIEPYAVGQSTYVFGLREPPGEIRTFKVERIKDVTLTEELYTIPDTFNPQELLSDAWGIWFTQEEPVEVVLVFSPAVVTRVLQTRWHKSEQTQMRSDGSLIWRAKIADPTEMSPWIRGWGAEVEVISPDTLRSALAQQSADLYKMYHA